MPGGSGTARTEPAVRADLRDTRAESTLDNLRRAGRGRGAGSQGATVPLGTPARGRGPGARRLGAVGARREATAPDRTSPRADGVGKRPADPPAELALGTLPVDLRGPQRTSALLPQEVRALRDLLVGHRHVNLPGIRARRAASLVSPEIWSAGRDDSVDSCLSTRSHARNRLPCRIRARGIPSAIRSPVTPGPRRRSQKRRGGRQR